MKWDKKENKSRKDTIYLGVILGHISESEGVSVTQSCPTLYDPMDCSPRGSSAHGILQQEYCSGLPFPSPGDPGVAISFSRGRIGFLLQSLYLSDPGIEPKSPALQTDSLLTEPPGKTLEHLMSY